MLTRSIVCEAAYYSELLKSDKTSQRVDPNVDINGIAASIEVWNTIIDNACSTCSHQKRLSALPLLLCWTLFSAVSAQSGEDSSGSGSGEGSDSVTAITVVGVLALLFFVIVISLCAAYIAVAQYRHRKYRDTL